MTTNASAVAYVAGLNDPAQARAATAALAEHAQLLATAGVENLQFFTTTIGSAEMILATMDLEAAPQADSTPWPPAALHHPLLNEALAQLDSAIAPHPRHADAPDKSPWVFAETVCKIRPANAAPPAATSTWHSAVTGLKKEKEAEYRLLHDNVWPGVIRAIGASNISRFDIFLIEFGDNEPHLFYLFQYTGKDFETDMKAQSDSPVNQRWWKFTDACQKPLPAATQGPWLDMTNLHPPGKHHD